MLTFDTEILWATKRTNNSVIKDIEPEISLET